MMPADIRKVSSFAVVGAIGFVTDAGLLLVAMHGLGWGPVASRALSFPTAVAITWMLNRTITFDVSARPRSLIAWEYVRYFVVQTVGGLVNFFIYVLLLDLHRAFRAAPVLALAIASAMAMFVNYSASKKLVFR